MALVAAKPLNEFGGWLRFFQVTCWLNVVVLVLVLPVFLIALFAENKPAGIAEDLSMVADAAVSLYLIRRILQVVQVPAKESSENIRGWLKIMLGLSLGFVALNLVIAYWKHGGAWSKDAEDVLRGAKAGVGWPLIWLGYFQQAKRVKAFYGEAAAQAAAAPPPASPGPAPAPLEPS